MRPLTIDCERSLDAVGGHQQEMRRGPQLSALADLTLLGKVHVEVHTEMPSTLILPDWEHLR